MKYLVLIFSFCFSLLVVDAQEEQISSKQNQALLEKQQNQQKKLDKKQSEIELVSDLRDKLKEMQRQGIGHASVEYREIELQIEEKLYQWRKGNPQYSRKEVKMQLTRFKNAETAWKDAKCVEIDRQRAAENQRQRELEKIEQKE